MAVGFSGAQNSDTRSGIVPEPNISDRSNPVGHHARGLVGEESRLRLTRDVDAVLIDRILGGQVVDELLKKVEIIHYADQIAAQVPDAVLCERIDDVEALAFGDKIDPRVLAKAHARCGEAMQPDHQGQRRDAVMRGRDVQMVFTQAVLMEQRVNSLFGTIGRIERNHRDYGDEKK